jgi:hypothetical protein
MTYNCINWFCGQAVVNVLIFISVQMLVVVGIQIFVFLCVTPCSSPRWIQRFRGTIFRFSRLRDLGLHPEEATGAYETSVSISSYAR